MFAILKDIFRGGQIPAGGLRRGNDFPMRKDEQKVQLSNRKKASERRS